MLEVTFDLQCILARNDYTVTVATQYTDGTSQDWVDDVCSFRVLSTLDIAGVVHVPTSISYSVQQQSVLDNTG
jgi:hypothetical protein